jgi:hypothetical protein
VLLDVHDTSLPAGTTIHEQAGTGLGYDEIGRRRLYCFTVLLILHGFCPVTGSTLA